MGRIRILPDPVANQIAVTVTVRLLAATAQPLAQLGELIEGGNTRRGTIVTIEEMTT